MRERRGDPAWPTPKFDFKALTQMMKDGQLYIPKPVFQPMAFPAIDDMINFPDKATTYRVTGITHTYYNSTYVTTLNV